MGTWWMEVFPIFLAVPILLATCRRFPLTPLVYTLIFVHACILMLGGHYTYARVPLGFWMQDVFGFARNHYDRIGHLAQGFVPAIVAREILLRRTPLASRRLAVLHRRAASAWRSAHATSSSSGGRRSLGGAAADAIPRHPGRRVGHAVGHADGAGRIDRRRRSCCRGCTIGSSIGWPGPDPGGRARCRKSGIDAAPSRAHNPSMVFVLLATLFFQSPQPPPQLPPGHPVVSSSSYVPQRVFDTRQKAFSDFESMLADLARADVVFVGEQHDDPNTHRLELAVVEGLTRRGVPVVVAIEMFERDVQSQVEGYAAGRSTEEQFLKDSRPWPRYATDYRPLIEFAKTHHLPVVASNVPRRIASDVSKNGMPAIDKLGADRASRRARCSVRPAATTTAVRRGDGRARRGERRTSTTRSA